MGVSTYGAGQWRADASGPDGRIYLGIFDTHADAMAAVSLEEERLRNGTSKHVVSGKRTITIGQFAAEIAVPRGTVKRWVHEGMPSHLVGRLRRISPPEARAWIAANHSESVSFARQSLLYFAQRDDGPIKIGWTSDVERRLRELRKAEKRPVTLLAAVPGDKPEELRLHARFGAHRLEGEWFLPADDIVEFVRSLGDAA